MSITVTKRDENGVNVLSVFGRVVFGEEANALRREVKDALQESGGPIVINLADVPYMDSGGVGALVALFTSARAMGSDIKFSCVTPKVRHVLEITRLMDILGVCSSDQEAVAAISRKASA